jgi:hypothetical protein
MLLVSAVTGDTSATNTIKTKPTSASQRVLANSNWLSDDTGSQTRALNLPVHSDELARLPLHPAFNTDADETVWNLAWPQHMDTQLDYDPHDANGQKYANTIPIDPRILSFDTTSSTPFTFDTPASVHPDKWFSNQATAQGNALDSMSILSNQALELLSTAPNGMEYVP